MDSAPPSKWSQIRRNLGPHDTVEARWAAVVMSVLVALAMFLMTMIDVYFGGSWVFANKISAPEPSVLNAVILPLGLLAWAGFIAALPRRVMTWAPVWLTLVGTLVVYTVAIFTHATDLSGQVFFALPLLYGAFVLRPLGSWFTMVTCSLTLAHVTLSQEPTPDRMSEVAVMVLLSAGIVVAFGKSQLSQHALRVQLRQSATEDPLTGLANRTALERKLKVATQETDPHLGAAFALVDLDRFKAINDVHGHPFGDSVIQDLAEHLTRAAGSSGTAARFGGDEFAIVVPHCAPDRAQELADALVDAVRHSPLTTAQGETVQYSVSVGVAHWPKDVSEGADLYSVADLALYEAKRKGRDQACYSRGVRMSAALPSQAGHVTDAPSPTVNRSDSAGS